MNAERPTEWWEAEVAMHRDRADRFERDLAKAEVAARHSEAIAVVSLGMVARAGVKPRTDDERQVVAWAVENPHIPGMAA